MPDTKLSALTELAATPATTDEVYIRDVSEAAADQSKRITVANLLAAYDALTATLTNKSIAASQLTGIIADARMPNLTGDVTTVEGAVSTTIANDAVTYAKMQNVSATDRVLGRTTAGAGDVEEIATTGSGSVVRATSPTLVTPALGTPASGVMTNVTGIPVGALANGTDGNLITWDANGVAAVVATGTAAQVLTSNGPGAAPTFQVGAGGAPAMIISTDFAAAGRYTDTLTGGGGVTYDSVGALANTSATGTSSADNRWRPIWQSGNLMVGSPEISCAVLYGNTAGSDFDWFIGVGGATTPTITGTAITFTSNHVGFKSVRAASGALTINATQADGTTENASASLFTPAAADTLDLIMKVDSTTSVGYYTRQNGGVISAATNLTTNMPTAANIVAFHNMVSNKAVASASSFYVTGASIKRP